MLDTIASSEDTASVSASAERRRAFTATTLPEPGPRVYNAHASRGGWCSPGTAELEDDARASRAPSEDAPDKLPCLGCKDRRPTDPEAIGAAIEDATHEQLARCAALCAGSRVA